MKVLITGANGFIGSMLVKFFVENEHSVVGWDIFEKNQFGIHVKKVDLSSEDIVIEQLRCTTPDILIHCAGCADVGKSVLYPECDYHGNVTLTHNLLFAMHELKMNNTRFVFLSSAAVYGNPINLPITEDMCLNPLSPYALHKVMCEEVCRYFANNYAIDTRIARIFSAYGEGLKKQIFWDMFNKAKTTGRLDMFGTGKESRDYIHVDDVIHAIYLIATTHSKDLIFNVANGEEVAISTVTEYFANCAGISRENIYFNGVLREGEPLNWRADILKLKALGYSKNVDMEDGIKEYFKWAETMKG